MQVVCSERKADRRWATGAFTFAWVHHLRGKHTSSDVAEGSVRHGVDGWAEWLFAKRKCSIWVSPRLCQAFKCVPIIVIPSVFWQSSFFSVGMFFPPWKVKGAANMTAVGTAVLVDVLLLLIVLPLVTRWIQQAVLTYVVQQRSDSHNLINLHRWEAPISAVLCNQLNWSTSVEPQRSFVTTVLYSHKC